MQRSRYCLACGKLLPDYRMRQAVYLCNAVCQADYRDGRRADVDSHSIVERLGITKRGISRDISARGYVYVMHDRYTGLYKIGLSIDPGERVKSVRHDHPQTTLLFHRKVDNMRRAEMILHGLYGHRHVSGEWFRLTPMDVDEIRRFGND